jgi:hypothetical protein
MASRIELPTGGSPYLFGIICGPPQWAIRVHAVSLLCMLPPDPLVDQCPPGVTLTATRPCNTSLRPMSTAAGTPDRGGLSFAKSLCNAISGPAVGDPMPPIASGGYRAGYLCAPMASKRTFWIAYDVQSR